MNVTPRPNEEIMDWYYDVCKKMGEWMKHSKEAVFDVNLNAPLPTLDKTQNYTTVKEKLGTQCPMIRMRLSSMKFPNPKRFHY